jgi:hypothetical protein
MKTAEVTIEGISPLSQARFHNSLKLDKESPSDYEARTWREKCHFDGKTRQVLIPPMAFKGALAETARFLGEKIPGKGNSTWRKHFDSGVLCVEPLLLAGINRENLESEQLFVPSDGVRGSGKRVMKIFPVIRQWGGKVIYLILDDLITENVFAKHVNESGKFIGIGRFRPQSGGFYGRFEVKSVQWSGQ